MGRLYRGLWYCEGVFADGSAITTQPVPYDQAAVEAPMLGASGVYLKLAHRSRAAWEFLANYEASDPPVWGQDNAPEGNTPASD